jgi:hypothetical protein
VGGPPAWGLGVGLTTFHLENFVTKSHKEPWTWIDSLDKRTQPRNMDMRFGTWNIKSLYRAGSHVRWVPLSPQHGASSGCGWKGRSPDLEVSCEYIE